MYTKKDFSIDLIYQEYVKRLKHITSLYAIEIKTEYKKKLSKIDREKILNNDSKKIRKRIPKNDLVIILDEKGKKYTSKDFADKMNTWGNLGKNLTFILGGPEGLARDIKIFGHDILSLSDMTLSHSMSKVILIEQIYRAYTIIKNHPYHRSLNC